MYVKGDNGRNETQCLRSETGMQRVVMVLMGALSLTCIVGHAGRAAAEEMIKVDNGSPSMIKVVGDGGKAVVDSGAKGVQVRFEGGTDIGIDLKIWWVAKPRELCQLFVPWDRTVVVSGTSTIHCRSQ
jgi:hypothetical protein